MEIGEGGRASRGRSADAARLMDAALDLLGERGEDGVICARSLALLVPTSRR